MRHKRMLAIAALTALSACSAGLMHFAWPQHSGGYYKQIFQAGNQAFVNKDFAAALERYKELLNMELADPVLYFNAGNAYAQLGQAGRATYMYEKALRLDPRDEAAAYNLRKVEPEENRQTPFILLAPFVSLLRFLTLDEWAWLFSALWFATAILIAAALLVETDLPRRYSKFCAWIVGAFCLFALSMLGVKYQTQVLHDEGIVLEYVVTRAGPSGEFNEEFKLPTGRKVRVTHQSPEGWCEIAIPGESKQTYIPADKLGLL
ncbi:tetratricopeptide repeat protein [Candidatus Sumerlaeota bacterium]|nr:tetratricopeptide repeat protein [Candidatus Sumerlaeota bacterium]